LKKYRKENMKTYKVAYSENSVYIKKFKAKSKEDAVDIADKQLRDNGWDTSLWNTGSGGGSYLEVIDEDEDESEDEE
jgi:hypothetical protein